MRTRSRISVPGALEGRAGVSFYCGTPCSGGRLSEQTKTPGAQEASLALKPTALPRPQEEPAGRP